MRWMFLIAVMWGGGAMAQAWETFGSGAETRWGYVADGVMGGVSQGQAALEGGVIRLTGDVSTANNGGFIQVRNRFGGGWPENAEGLRLDVRGNGEEYWVFLRTEGLARVWYSYRASFVAGADWAEVTLPFAAFRPSNDGMPEFDVGQVISIGIVAYGRDFEADVSVREIGVF